MKVVALFLLFIVAVSGKYYPSKVYESAGNLNFTRAHSMGQVMKLKTDFWDHCAENGECPDIHKKSMSSISCEDGLAGDYFCNNVDLVSYITKEDLAKAYKSGNGNDIWGWEDPVSGQKIVIACEYYGTAFVDISVPSDPQVLGFLPTHTSGISWRDVKVYKDHAYIVSEAKNHGMQVFDLTQLRPYTDRNVQYKETAHYDSFGSSHNIVINEDSGFAYVVGSKLCAGGLYMINIQEPQAPVYAGCFSDDKYTHDAQCVNYKGPDPVYAGKEICFAYNEDTLTIVDVSNKNKPIEISRTGYNGFAYTHQGWLTSDSRFAIMNDELDEVYKTSEYGQNTRTMVWNVEKLDAPKLAGSYVSELTVIDHNLYIDENNRIYLSNYCGGLRVYDFKEDGVDEVAFFDIAPNCDTTDFLGAWSSYPYFGDGLIAVNGIESGLYILKINA